MKCAYCNKDFEYDRAVHGLYAKCSECRAVGQFKRNTKPAVHRNAVVEDAEEFGAIGVKEPSVHRMPAGPSTSQRSFEARYIDNPKYGAETELTILRNRLSRLVVETQTDLENIDCDERRERAVHAGRMLPKVLRQIQRIVDGEVIVETEEP